MSEGGGVGGYARSQPPPGAVRLDLNEAPRDASEAFRRRTLERLAEKHWRRYPDLDNGSARAAAAALYGWQRGGTLVGNGSNELLAATVRALLPDGGTLLTLAPSFSMYPVLARRAGARHVTHTLLPPAFAADASRLAEQASRADLVVLSSPNNPTGGELTGETLEAVAATGRPLVLDAAYAEFSRSDPLAVLQRFSTVLVLRTLSKAWGLAGLRVGALLAAPEMAERVMTQLLPFDTGWLVQAAFETAVELRGEGEAMVREIVAERERELTALAALDGVDTVPSCGNFYLLRRRGWIGDRLAAAMGDRGLSLRPLAELNEAGYVRVTVGTKAEGDRLLAALEEVAHG